LPTPLTGVSETMPYRRNDRERDPDVWAKRIVFSLSALAPILIAAYVVYHVGRHTW
jgi:hypothetical protein